MGGRPSRYGRTIPGERARSYTPRSDKKTQDDAVEQYDPEFLRAARVAAENGQSVHSFAEYYSGPVVCTQEPHVEK